VRKALGGRSRIITKSTAIVGGTHDSIDERRQLSRKGRHVWFDAVLPLYTANAREAS
jgi:hypothetical protein